MTSSAMVPYSYGPPAVTHAKDRGDAASFFRNLYGGGHRAMTHGLGAIETALPHHSVTAIGKAAALPAAVQFGAGWLERTKLGEAILHATGGRMGVRGATFWASVFARWRKWDLPHHKTRAIVSATLIGAPISWAYEAGQRTPNALHNWMASMRHHQGAPALSGGTSTGAYTPGESEQHIPGAATQA